MGLPLIIDPGDNVFVSLDWSDQLDTGVSLVTVTHTVDPALTLTSPQTDAPNKRSAVKLTGVQHGGRYMLTGAATLSTGEIVNRQFPLLGWNS